MKSRAPQLHLEYRFYKQLGQSGKLTLSVLDVCCGGEGINLIVLEQEENVIPMLYSL